MPSLTITEPHPTVPKNSYTHSGRGGAGNYFRAPTTTPSSGVATKPTAAPRTTSRFYSGRGGAGNAHVAAAKPVLSFDEEFTHKSHIEQKPVGYVGRGGAGNVYGASSGGLGTVSRKGSDASSQHSSSSSGSLSNIWSRISHRH
ncbi:uncharacterized protein F4812DRAFT_99574 [Daldinia caldariorum]|uniref:uncharacterized protein n=1 Tax=Daldinia caldariorum TaxID=326644 RepID=UPI002007E284|nr:uncharacterized protein F4812DRAFT_99574 [Daldinia caldariorum]KAI1466192.1 hypothetical protein F4812DRAFT_99574 [Daldinia caldariorum]